VMATGGSPARPVAARAPAERRAPPISIDRSRLKSPTARV